MKASKIAIITLLLLTCAILLNSYLIDKFVTQLTKDVDEVSVEDLELATVEFEEIFEKFSKIERFISITVSHDDLTNIEESFSEIIGSSKAKNLEEVVKVKSRLKDALEHLKRLSKINLDSIL